MKYLIALAFFSITAVLFTGCSSVENIRPYNPISTADGPETSSANNAKCKSSSDAVSILKPVGYKEYESAIADTSYTQDEVSLRKN